MDADHAHELDVRAGDRVTLTFEGRPVHLTVAATLPGAGPYGGNFFVPAGDLTRTGADRRRPRSPPTPRRTARRGGSGRAVTDTLTGPERGDGRVVAEDAAAQDTGSDDLRTTATTAVLHGALGGALGLALGVPYSWLVSVSPRRALPSPSRWGSSRRSSSSSSW